MSVSQSLGRLQAWLARFNAPVCEAGCQVAGAITIGMLLVVMVQVIARYVLNDSLSWSEELSKLAMVWATFLVTPWAMRTQAHVSIEFFVDALGPRTRWGLALVVNGLLLGILLVLLNESLDFVRAGFAIRAASLPMAVGWAYLVVPMSLALCALVTVERLVGLARGGDDNDNDSTVGAAG